MDSRSSFATASDPSGSFPKLEEPPFDSKAFGTVLLDMRVRFWLLAIVLRRFSGNEMQLQRQEILKVPILERQIRFDLHSSTSNHSRKTTRASWDDASYGKENGREWTPRTWKGRIKRRCIGRQVEYLTADHSHREITQENVLRRAQSTVPFQTSTTLP